MLTVAMTVQKKKEKTNLQTANTSSCTMQPGIEDMKTIILAQPHYRF
jgi:hypothetical protein